MTSQFLQGTGMLPQLVIPCYGMLLLLLTPSFIASYCCLTLGETLMASVLLGGSSEGGNEVCLFLTPLPWMDGRPHDSTLCKAPPGDS